MIDTLSCIIVDDDQLDRMMIVTELAAHPTVKMLGEYGNPIEAITSIKSQKPDILFLDIDMPEVNGIDLIKSIADFNTINVLITAHSEFVLQSFQLKVFDYILKPLGTTRFETCIDRIFIQRKLPTDQAWKEIAQTNFPDSKITLKARLMQAPVTLRQRLAMSDTVVKVLWRRAEGAIYTDSIKPYDEIPLYATALGVSYLDTTATLATYQYRIYTRNTDQINVDSAFLKINYRPSQMNATLVPIEYEAADEAVAITYHYKGVKNQEE